MHTESSSCIISAELGSATATTLSSLAFFLGLDNRESLWVENKKNASIN